MGPWTPGPKAAPKAALFVLSLAVDILFVIDNSNSMSEEQQFLASPFSSMVSALTSGGKFPDMRIGITSTDLGAGTYGLPSCAVTGGDQGKLLVESSCSAKPSAPYISAVGPVAAV